MLHKKSESLSPAIQPPNDAIIPEVNDSSEENKSDPQCVKSCANEILAFCLRNEIKNINKIDYFQKTQREINDKMRAVLINWLIDVHARFKMLPQTLF